MDCLEAVRVDAPGGMASTCSLMHRSLGPSRAWVDSSGSLAFGTVDHHLQMRFRHKGTLQL